MPYQPTGDVDRAVCGSCWGILYESADVVVVNAPEKPQEPFSTIRSRNRAANEREALKGLWKGAMGNPPWKCFWCEGEVMPKVLVIHHADGNHQNNSLRNLRAAHKNCHWAAHDAGAPVQVESLVSG